jgi:hypothetical protein
MFFHFALYVKKKKKSCVTKGSDKVKKNVMTIKDNEKPLTVVAKEPVLVFPNRHPITVVKNADDISKDGMIIQINRAIFVSPQSIPTTVILKSEKTDQVDET